MNIFFHQQMEEIKKFAVTPEKIQEALYPSCKKVSDLTEEKLIAIAIRTRLSVQGYVQSVAYQSCSIVCLSVLLSVHPPTLTCPSILLHLNCFHTRWLSQGKKWDDHYIILHDHFISISMTRWVKSMMKTEIQKELWFWRRKGMVVVQHSCPLDYGGRKQI